ncbi:hypothetical protein CKM354_000886300 [Cercospora kikuchii]|nr:uncharacterized protein CKM354_000886300 [Cercospora kikuchii]GIZ45707.1 hypothetical protein CKM354_000886300 [Cercospora kikuchii]
MHLARPETARPRTRNDMVLAPANLLAVQSSQAVNPTTVATRLAPQSFSLLQLTAKARYLATEQGSRHVVSHAFQEAHQYKRYIDKQFISQLYIEDRSRRTVIVP